MEGRTHEQRGGERANITSESELNLLRLVLESIPEGLVVAAPDGSFLFFNDAAERILGIRSLDVDPDKWSEKFGLHRLDGVELPAENLPLVRALSGESVSNFKLLVRNKTRKKGLVISVNAEPLYSDENELIAAVCTFLDVSEAYRSSDISDHVPQAIEYREIINSLHEGLWMIDDAGTTVYVNQTMARLLDYEVDEMIGQPVFKFVAEENHDHCRTQGERRRQGIKEDYEMELLGRDGKGVDVIVQASPLYGRTGRYRGSLLGVLDITCRKKTSRELELAHEQLETVVEERTAELSTALKEVERLSEHLESENLRLRRQVIQTRNPPDIVGSSSALQKVMHQISQVAQTETSVLLSGETGTGKGLVAGCLHSQSHHADRPLITVDCGTLQPSLIESELFGHEKGAFTGALVARAGWFELADGGTLFLDEVGELPLGAQVKLLRVLQSGEFERLGSTQTRQVNIRIICATNRDLGAMVQDRSFRSDLFFRLSVFPIEIPPLRERIEDLPDLVRFIISKKKRSVGVVNIDDASTEFLERLAQYAWPGNVRELENVVERALILATGRSLEVEDLGGSLGPVNPTAIDPTQSVGSWRENERRFLVKALTASNWKVKGAGNAADRVGIPASTFRDRMNRLGIVKPQAKSISRDQKEESHRPGKSGDSLA